MSSSVSVDTQALQRVQPVPGQAGLAVPWLTVLPMVVVMAYGDGFWATSLRGAVGAVARTGEPFAAWWRQSTLTMPMFLLAVLAAVTLALRLFGPVLRTPRSVVVTALLVAGAGTLVGIAMIAAGAVYDYHLQSEQLELMGSMRGSCDAACLAGQVQHSLSLQVRAVGYGSGLILLTNIVLVGWLVALRGGRLHVTSSRRRTALLWRRTAPAIATAETPRGNRGRGHRVDDLRIALASGLVGAGAIHAGVVQQHLAEWGPAGSFFVLLAAAELGAAGLVLTRAHRAVLQLAMLLSGGPLLLWAETRVFGLPFGPQAGIREAVGLADCAAGLLELGTLIVSFVLLRHRQATPVGPRSAHTSDLVLAAVVAVTVLGLSGSGLAWFGGLLGGEGAASVSSSEGTGSGGHG